MGRAAAVAVLCALGCRTEELPPVYGSQLHDVSLIQILADPGQFDGRLVRVRGFCSIAFEDVALYLHREDYDHMLLKNAMWLDVGNLLPPASKDLRDRVGQRYCLVEGRVDARSHGHLGSCSGTIREITRLEPSPSRAELEKRLSSAPTE
jgi:hypothetical protein